MAASRLVSITTFPYAALADEALTDGQHEAKPDARVMILVPDLISFGYRAMDGPVVITPATKDAFRTRSDERAAISGDAAEVTREAILAPLPYVPAHVVKA